MATANAPLYSSNSLVKAYFAKCRTFHCDKALKMAAAKVVKKKKDFDFAHQAILDNNAFEIFFLVIPRRRRDGNFYIEIMDIVASSKVANLYSFTFFPFFNMVTVHRNIAHKEANK